MTERLQTRAASGESALGTLSVILFSRTILNSSYRIIYPFLPAISRGLGVSLTAVSLLITVRSFVGLSSPLFGPVSDRYGRRVMMLSGLALMVAGALLLAGAPLYQAALLAFALFGIAKAIYDPALQAYVGDWIPYHRRGRVMGIIEFSWAAAWLLGVPVAGYLIEFQGWQAPFVVIAVLGLLSIFLTRRLPSPDREDDGRVDLHWRALLSDRNALGALIMSGLMVFANENIFVVYGAWMESTFGLSVSGLGLASIVIGGSEIVAEGSMAAFVDRIGKKRAVAGGMLLTAGAYLLLPAMTRSLAVAMVGLAVVFVAFEFTIVSSLPLVSELTPATRGTLMALNVAALSGGRMLGSVTATPLWLHGGMVLNGVVSAGAALASLTVLVVWIREGG